MKSRRIRSRASAAWILRLFWRVRRLTDIVLLLWQSFRGREISSVAWASRPCANPIRFEPRRARRTRRKLQSALRDLRVLRGFRFLNHSHGRGARVTINVTFYEPQFTSAPKTP